MGIMGVLLGKIVSLLLKLCCGNPIIYLTVV